MSKYVHTEIDGYPLKLSNLDKVLYPKAMIVKAEVIQYYMKMAPIILKYLGNRPLTLIRYPDGIEGTRFYSKTCPEWAPNWVKRQDIQHSEETVPYAVIQKTAGLVWLANLAALEMHPMQMTVDEMDKPDHFIFDLDPPENESFEAVKQIALDLNQFLRKYDYTPFVKTSGSKGLHIIVPIKKEYSHEEMVETTKNLAKIFVQQNSKTCTLQLQKGSRGGKLLVDIYRNHMAQTTVSAYSTRAKPHAPISCPISWDQLEKIESSQAINITNIDEHIHAHGDVWRDVQKFAAELHDRSSSFAIEGKAVNAKLSSYLSKRNFGQSPEPKPKKVSRDQNRFCIQLHDASNLHYDLRLEQEGVLMSWAIPKGMPTKKGVKRLAIRTEDHPMEYLEFEGTIPKGEYGAGEMWVFAKGKIKWNKKSESSYKFTLESPQMGGSYRLYKTGKEDQWLIERTDEVTSYIPKGSISPQLADQIKEVPKGFQYTYEIKWDGLRSLIFLEDGKVRIQARSGNDLTDQFPELLLPDDAFDVESGVFDGEIICMDEKGRPVFANVISRLHTSGEASIRRAMERNPVYCYLFDCLYLDGRNICQESQERRQAWLKSSLKRHEHYRLSEPMRDGQALYEAAKAMTLEGIMAKDKSKPYEIGKRNTHWLKIKFRESISCTIIGYTKGRGDRSNQFGALHIAQKEEDQWKYLGKVGTGFDGIRLNNITAQIQKLEERSKYIEDKIEEANRTVWIEPVLRCEVEFASWTPNKTLREPVFKGLLK